MTEEEHKIIVANLRKIYESKYIIEDNEPKQIIDVMVDYRKESQHMNRVVLEDGNILFLNEIKEVIDERDIGNFESDYKSKRSDSKEGTVVKIEG